MAGESYLDEVGGGGELGVIDLVEEVEDEHDPLVDHIQVEGGRRAHRPGGQEVQVG